MLTPVETQLLGEVQRLHVKVDALHAQQRMRYGFLRHVVRDLEYDPKLQYRVHIIAAIFWAFNLPAILLIIFAFPDFWGLVGVGYVAIQSVWANFATDWGAASACLAAMGSTPLPELPTEPRTA